MKKNRIILFALLSLLLCLTACSSRAQEGAAEQNEILPLPKVMTESKPPIPAPDASEAQQAQTKPEEAEPSEDAPQEAIEPQRTDEPEKAEQADDWETEAQTDWGDQTDLDEPSFLIAIDPGHQAQANGSTEPIGPGAAEQKARTAAGTYGRASGLAEYELNLQVSLLLRQELERRGYQVILTRETNDVDLSNRERAEIANEAGADACVRIHANASDDPSVNGVMTICMTGASPYNAFVYEDSYALSEAVLDGVIAATGARREYIWQTDTMSGINWSTLPVTILEMGYMTNPEEDARLATAEYQKQIVSGIADGLDAFFEGRVPGEKPAEQPLRELERLLQGALSGLTSEWDVWAERLSDGAAVHCTQNTGEKPQMVSASLIKLFIMGAVYEKAEAGELSLEDASADLYSMITRSDNDAANALTRLLGGGDAAAGMRCVTQWAAQIGCADVQHNRLMLDSNGLENFVSAESCAKILRMIYEGSCVSRTASARMLQMLSEQQVNDRLPMALPEGTVCAHKTGNLAGLCVADVGIVFGEKQDYILCVICNKPYTEGGATNKVIELAELTDAYFSR